MSFTRARALRSLQASLRHSGARATPRVAAPRRTQQLLARRFASSDSHGAHGASSSDIPWAIGAVAATIPSVWYLWPDTSHADAGHHGEHHAAEEHEEEASDDQAAEAPKEEEAPAEEADKSDDSSKEDKSDESADAKEGDDKDEEPKDESEGKDDEESKSEDKSSEGDSKSGTTGKGKMHSESDGHNDSRKSEPDSKGASKKRIDSGLAKNLGAGSASETPADKHDGLSNTDTKHSTKIDEPGSEKSTKSEGGPETAKVKGAVDPNRPAR